MTAEEERPSKLRKLSHDFSQTAEQEIRPTDNKAAVEQPVPVIVNEPQVAPATSNNEDRATKDQVAECSTATASVTPNVIVPPTHPLYALSLANPTASKSQLKKLRRQQEWEEARDERKEKRKEQATAKKARKRAARDDYLAENNLTLAEHSQQKAVDARNNLGVTLPITFLIDCDFDDLMKDSERVSLSGQITRAYSDNRKARWRGHVVLSSFGGKLRERHDTTLKRNYESWHYFKHFREPFAVVAKDSSWMSGKHGGKLAGPFEKYIGDLRNGSEPVPSSLDDQHIDSSAATENNEAADVGMPKGTEEAEVSTSPKQKKAEVAARHEALRAVGEIVYLSSESPNTLTELKPYSTYIVGGLVDKNREKGICYKRATAAGMTTARLPIGEYLQMQSRKVLATNHVVEIMLRWLEYGDWGKAFVAVMPKRKGGVLKEDVGEAGDAADVEAAEDDGMEDDTAQTPAEVEEDVLEEQPKTCDEKVT